MRLLEKHVCTLCTHKARIVSEGNLHSVCSGCVWCRLARDREPKKPPGAMQNSTVDCRWKACMVHETMRSKFGRFRREKDEKNRASAKLKTLTHS